MGLWRLIAKELKPNTKDDRRRDFQKARWRKRVDAEMGAAKRGEPGYWVCMNGHRHRVHARALECNEKTARARGNSPEMQKAMQKAFTHVDSAQRRGTIDAEEAAWCFAKLTGQDPGPAPGRLAKMTLPQLMALLNE
jgi:hypothetical protein